MTQGFGTGWRMATLLGRIAVAPYLTTEAFVRLAYAAFYLRVLPPELEHLLWHRWIIIVSVTAYALFQILYAFLYLFACGNPINATDPNASCLEEEVLVTMFHASYYGDAALDWMMTLIPISVIWKTTMNKRAKLSVILILLLGCFAGGLAIAIIILSRSSGWELTNAEDKRRSIVINILATFETQVAIVCLSLAALRPLFKKLMETNTGSYMDSSSQGSSSKSKSNVGEKIAAIDVEQSGSKWQIKDLPNLDGQSMIFTNIPGLISHP
ncbi:hypothetical protein K461DRAFT_305522 [Myriangium duriaei CBS 260.36]|uniref:Rhodopsin domain-containing protein n=1 Tax=Myriangium duriaei CBS 260.36 TaxID=1168546 RepID=A0A9P4J5I2_9PEZI|nr:hypothetical protein K461DRAFT_305522 [Myriangium duriaei CBS 260.36]